MNPVVEGLISYSDLKNGNVNLWDLYLLNLAIEDKYDTKKSKHGRHN